MHYLLFIFAYLWFAFIAPFKVVVAVSLSFLLVLTVVKVTATAVVGNTTFNEAFKSVALSFAFLAVALFTLISFNKGTGGGAPLLFVVPAFLGAYILGFKMGLSANFGASSIIAGVSTAISVLLYFVLKPLLS